MFSSDDRLEYLLSRKAGEASVGEGDLKFTDIQNEIQSLKTNDRAFRETKLVITMQSQLNMSATIMLAPQLPKTIPI